MIFRSHESGPRSRSISSRIFYHLFVICFLFSVLTLSTAFASETIVESNILEYDSKTTTYTAGGRVKITKDSTVIDADKVIYNEKTGEVSAEGNINYIDLDVRIRASKAFLNLEDKTGRLIEAEVFFKKDNYHIKGSEIERRAEKEYFLKGASFTTCDAPLPAWCFKGRDIHIILDDRVRARDVTFNIKGLPVFYSPYLTAPLQDRKTGLLIPSIGFVEHKGLHYEQPFFWAISENRDATLTLDIYGRRGSGEGIEYRHLEKAGLRGTYWVYHLRDDRLRSDFWDIKGLFDKRDGDITAFVNLNYINSLLYYREYNPYVSSRRAFLDPASYLNITTGRFLESTAEVRYRLSNSSISLQSQYFIDLKDGADQSTVPQRLPEITYVRYPERIGPVTFSLITTATNFWREARERGQRLDLYPRLTFAAGDAVIVTHSLGLRATLYSMNSNDESSNRLKTGLDYSITVLTRLQKRYSNITHIIEPSIDYTFIPSLRSDIPLFDSTELYSKTSRFNLSIMNRFLSSNGEFLTLRFTQPVDTNRGDRPLLPVLLEASIKGPLTMRGEVSYDPGPGKIEDLNSDLSLNLSHPSLWLSIGERYRRTEDILYYSLGLRWNPLKSLSYEGYLWYDAKTGNTKNIIARIKYQRQCWGITAIVTKRERDYSFSLLFDLLGIGTVKI